MSEIRRPTLIAWAICALVTAWGINYAVRINIPAILAWDILGYYLYLPAVFIVGDIGLQDIGWLREMFEQYSLPGTIYQVNVLENGNWAMRYSSGWAVLYLPFFLIGHLFAITSGEAVDGFSAPYQWAMFCGSLFYFALGAVLLMRILLRWFSVPVSVITFLAVFLGTNYLHVNTSSAGMPHVHLFTLYAALILITDRWHRKEGGLANSAMLGVVIGLIALSRPVDVVCAVIPLLWGVTSSNSFVEKITRLWQHHKADLLLVIITVAAIGSIQILYWLKVTGKPIYHGYDGVGEGLDLMFPHTIDFLFSFRKGWFIYTPMMVLAVFGFFLMRREPKGVLVTVIVFTGLYVYLVSSWTNWWYADSFSQRPMMHVYAVLAIPLAAYVRNALAGRRWMLIPIPLFIILNIVQTWQTERHIIDTTRMSWPYYKAVFFKNYVPKGAKNLLLVDRSESMTAILRDSALYEVVSIQTLGFDSDNDEIHGLTQDTSHSGCCAIRMDNTVQFSPAVESNFEELTGKDHAWLEVSAMVYLEDDGAAQRPTMVLHFMHEGQVYHYMALDVSAQIARPREWTRVRMFVVTPEPRRRSDPMRTYAWMQGSGTMLIDDFTLTTLERKKLP